MSRILTLPAELRIKIYETMIYGALGPSSLGTLDYGRGLVLSCKQIYFEFELEWCKAMKTISAVITQDTIFYTSTVSSLASIINLRVHMIG